MLNSTPLSDGLLKQAFEIISQYPSTQKRSAVIPILHLVQQECGGWLTEEAMNHVAALLEIQPIQVYEVATFYTMFRLKPTGKYVFEVCQTGPCCLVGAEEIIAYLEKKLGISVGETTPDGLFTLQVVECLASCGTGPVLQFGEAYIEHLTPQKIDDLVDSIRKESLQ